MEKCVNISKKYSIQLSEKRNGKIIEHKVREINVVISAFEDNFTLKTENYFNEQVDKLLNCMAWPENSAIFIRHEMDITQKPGTPFGHLDSLESCGYEYPQYKKGDKLFKDTGERKVWKKFLLVRDNDFNELLKFVWNHYDETGLSFKESDIAKADRESLEELLRFEQLSYGRRC